MSYWHYQREGLPRGFRVYAGDRLLLTLGPGATSFVVGDLGLADGRHVLTVVRTDRCVSDGRSVSVVVSGGLVSVVMRDAAGVTARAEAGGAVRLRWRASVAAAEQGIGVLPAVWELGSGLVADGVLSVVASEVGGVSWRERVLEVGEHGLSDGSTGVFAVRSSDGEVGGVRGPWVRSGVVVVDATGPLSPVVLGGVLSSGGCG